MPRKLSDLTRKLADEYAGMAFRSDCYPRGDNWYAIPGSGERTGDLNNVLRYLRARKMLERNHATGHYRIRSDQ